MIPGGNKQIVTIGIVVPVYNEEEVIKKFHQRLTQAIDELLYDITIYYVNDGSSDGTSRLLGEIAETDSRVVIIELSRNFGHQAALTAGLDLADGDVVIMMDGDGQHPPELIPQMLDLFRVGYDIVLTQRTNDQKLSLFKRETSSLFYRLLNRITDTRMISGAADYRLMSRQVVNALGELREYHRFLRGMIAWMGYGTVILPYKAPERLGGRSKYSIKKMAKLAMDAVFSFSLVPLQIGISLGLCFFVLAAVEVAYVLGFWFRGQQALLVPGWSSLMFIILVVGGILMIITGFIGLYTGYIFQEVKRRPIYLIKTLRTRLAGPTEPGTMSANDRE